MVWQWIQREIEAVILWPVPTCRRDVEIPSGFVNYHRNHIKGYAELAAPLYESLEKKSFTGMNHSRQLLRP